MNEIVAWNDEPMKYSDMQMKVFIKVKHLDQKNVLTSLDLE